MCEWVRWHPCHLPYATRETLFIGRIQARCQGMAENMPGPVSSHQHFHQEPETRSGTGFNKEVDYSRYGKSGP